MSAGTPGETPADGYTQRDVERKAQVEGSLLMRPGGSDRCPAGAMVSVRGRCYAWISCQVHARSLAGTCQVHPAAGAGELRRQASRGSAARSPTPEAARRSTLGTGRRLGRSCDVLRRATRPDASSSCRFSARMARQAGHGELGFLVVLRPWHWARVSGERHFLALRRGQ